MSHPVAEIFSQGDEIVTGEIADTNAAWLSGELTALGFEVARHTAVGDRLNALIELLREVDRRADLCLCSGGLGPTCDDLTAEAAGIAFGLSLKLDETALAQIEAWFARLGRTMPEANKKQAWLPRGAERLDNLWGTAPGFVLKAGRCRFVFMPGVPGEMKAMFRQQVRPDLVHSFKLRPARRVVLRTVGVGESVLQERLDRIVLPAGVRLGFRAGGTENFVKLLFPADFSEPEGDETVRRAMEAIGEAVYAVGDGEESEGSLESAVGRQLAARHATLYAVETASGGALANRCAGENWFAGAAVESDPARLLRRFGMEAADSLAATASRLAEQARTASGADYVLAQYGAFDLDALRSESTRIEIQFALAGPFGSNREASRIGGGLPRKKNTAAALGLDFVRRCLTEDGR